MLAAFSAMPSWLSLLLAIVLANVLAFIAYAVVARFAKGTGIARGSPAIGAWATAAGSLSALLFTFTIVTLWNAESRAASAVDSEAVAIRTMARDISPAQLQLVRSYLQASIAEWPALCGGGDFSRSQRALEALVHQAKARSKEYDDDLFRQLTAAEMLRAQRLRASTSGVPQELWIALVAIALVMFVTLAFSLIDHTPYHAALTVAYATAIGVVFWVAALLDFPFCGGTSISSAALVHALEFIGAR